MTNLPQELIEAIIEEVDDPDALKACSTTAAAFLVPSQRSIFRCVRLRGTIADEGTSNLVAAEDLFSAYPHLAFYIQALDMDIPPEKNHQHITKVLLYIMPRVRRLVIHGCFSDWSGVAGELAAALRDVITRPSLERLHIDYLAGIPPSFILLAALSIPILSVYQIEVGNGDDGNSNPSALLSSPRLRHLVLPKAAKGTGEFCRVLMCNPACLANLEHLSMVTNDYSSHYDARFLTTVASTLQHLELAFTHLSTYRLPTTIPSMPYLRIVELPVLLFTEDTGEGQLYSAQFVFTLAAIAAGCPLVEVVALHLFCRAFGNAFPTPLLQFPHLQEVKFPHLREVKCMLRDREDESLMQRLTLALQELLPALEGTSMLCWETERWQGELIDRLP